MKKTIRAITVFITVLCFSLSAFASAGVGKFTAVEGRCDVLHAGKDKSVPAKEGDPVYTGDIVRTKSNSKMEITFGDESKVRLAPSSRVGIVDYILGEKSHREKAAVRLYRGKCRAIVSKKGDPSNFKIITPSAEGVVRGTDIIAFYGAENTGMLVKSGQMAVFSPDYPDDVVELKKGQYIDVPLDEKPGKERHYLDAELSMYEKETKPSFAKRIGVRGEDLIKIRGVITFLAGDVMVYAPNDDQGHRAKLEEIVDEGNRVTTGSDSKVQIALENGNVLSLQEKTEIYLKTMRQDPKTGEYENTLESKYGKIKAVVEKLGGKSSFEVKTPTAVCGVRGTIIYLDITPGITSAFYEGGGGIMTNLFSGQTESLGAGQHSSADNMGNLAVPMTITGQERMNLDESWEAGQNIMGYSIPDEKTTSNTPLANRPIEERKRAIFDAFKEKVTEEDLKLEVFDEVPFREPVAPPVTDSTNFAGKFGRVVANSVATDPASWIKGKFSFSVPPNQRWQGQTASTLEGGYYNPNIRNIWVGGTKVLKATASDGGRYIGRIGGTMIKDSVRPNDGVFRSKSLCIFIDPSGWGGTFSTLSTGRYDSGTYTASGTSKFSRREYLGVSPDQLDVLIQEGGSLKNGKGKGNFDTPGILEVTSLGGSDVSIQDKSWGIWFIDIKGTFAGITSDNWTLAVGGEHENTVDGRIQSSNWLGSINGTEWNNNSLRGTFRGFYFDGSDETPGRVMGGTIFNGDFIGDWVNLPSREWEAIGGGEWTDITDLLTETGIGFTMAQFANFVSVPITERAFNTLNNIAAGSYPGFTAATMDIRFYTNDNSQNMWAAQIVGTHENITSPPSGWTLNLTGGADAVSLAGTQWSGGQWSANVTGNNSNVGNYTGQIAGTYDDNSFKGVGAGVPE